MLLIALGITLSFSIPQFGYYGYNRYRTPEPAINQPPPGFDSGFNGPSYGGQSNYGVADPGIQRFPY